MNNIKLAEETLGQRIKAQRIRVGYTQEQLAEIMCVPKSTISAYVITAAAILQGIKDEKIKTLLIGQMQVARKM